MATHKKSIKIPVNFGNPADLVNNTLTAIGTPTIYIPENNSGTPITITSAMLFIAAQDTSTVTGGTIGTFTARCTLSGAAASSVTITGTMANSGENWGGLFGPIDYTTYFNTNYGTVTSKTCAVDVLVNISTGTGTTTRGVYGYFEVTYTYDDTTSTGIRIQTIGVPYESSTSTLPTVATTYCTLKNLTGAGGLLAGYAGVTIRHRWIEIKGNCNNNATATNHNINYSFNGGATQVLPTRISTLASDTYQLHQIDASALSSTATSTLQLWESLASRYANIVVTEFISFEFTVSGTSRVVNYLELPCEFLSPIAGTTSAVSSVVRRIVNISEPGTITLEQGGVEIQYNTVASATPQISAGSQASYRAYAMASNVVAGAFTFQHGLDSSSALGAAFSLTNGQNTFDISLYRSAGTMTNVTGVIKLLYSSDVHSSGIDNHTRLIYSFIRQLNFTTTADDVVSGDSVQIPETNYYLMSAGLQYFLWTQGTAATFTSVTSQARLQSGEGAGSGWRDLFFDQIASDGELSYGGWFVRARDEFKKYPNDPDSDMMNIETARNIRTTISTASRFGYRWLAAYHSITTVVSGNITDSPGGTIAIRLFNSDTGQLYDSTTRSGDGSYSFTVYNPYANYLVEAYEDATHKGISKESTPATDFNISLLGGGSSAVTTGYAGG